MCAHVYVCVGEEGVGEDLWVHAEGMYSVCAKESYFDSGLIN